MKLKFMYGVLGYALLTFFIGFVAVACAVDLLQSVDFTVKMFMYLGLFLASGLVLRYFIKKSKQHLNLALIFSVFGQLAILFMIFAFGVYGHQSPQDKILSQDLEAIIDHELEPEQRIAQCEQTFLKNKDQNGYLVSDIERTCGRMILDISRESHLNVIPALSLINRLEAHQNKQGKSDLSPLRVCLIAESGEVDRALRIADRDKLDAVSKSLRQSGHCNMFKSRQIASEEF